MQADTRVLNYTRVLKYSHATRGHRSSHVEILEDHIICKINELLTLHTSKMVEKKTKLKHVKHKNEKVIKKIVNIKVLTIIRN